MLAYAPTRYGPYLSSGVFLTFNLSFPDLLLDVEAGSSCASCLVAFADAGFPLAAPGCLPYAEYEGNEGLAAVFCGGLASTCWALLNCSLFKYCAVYVRAYPDDSESLVL